MPSAWTNHKIHNKIYIPGSSGRSQRLFLHYFILLNTDTPIHIRKGMLESVGSQGPINIFLCAPLLNERLRILSLGTVLGHQRLLSLSAGQMLQIHLHLCIMQFSFASIKVR